MKTKILCALIGLGCFIQPVFAQDAATNTAPVIPEAARKHFVMGAALFKDAKTAEDYAQVTGEFEQAAELAPQWPEARYNLALSKEAAGDYSGAMDDLKRYQAFKLSETEARTVQDKIYVVEAKLAKAEKKKTEEQVKNSEQAQREKYLNSLAGYWRRHAEGTIDTSLTIKRRANSEQFDVIWGGLDTDNHWFYDDASGVRIEGNLLKFKHKPRSGGGEEYALSINNQGDLSGQFEGRNDLLGHYKVSVTFKRSQEP